MYVSDLERSYRFYHDVCGLQLVFDEVELYAKFLSNGNSHHDVALMEASTLTLVGRDGEVQKAEAEGTRAGLNHLAFEMATEAALVEGITKAVAAGYPVESTYDHQISRSVYLPGPDGVSVELYADSTTDWRGLYASLGDGLLSARWEPGGDGPPSGVPRYVQTFDHRPVADGVARPLRTARVTLVVSDLSRSVSFFREVIGLGLLEWDPRPGGWAILHGSLGLPDLLLVEQNPDQTVGFHHFSLELSDPGEVEATLERARSAGIPVVRTIDHALKRGIVVVDPDGVPVEFYAPVPDPDPGTTFASVATPAGREFLA
jgi:catechol 2,3-dioxygenase